MNWLLIISKSAISDNIKGKYIQVVTEAVLLYGFLYGNLTKCLEKKLDGNYTRMLLAF